MKNIVTFFVGLSFLASACSARKSESISMPAADSVVVISLTKQPVSKTLSLPAQLLPWEKADVYAKVEGYVRELRVDIGDRVRKNDILAILDAPEVASNYAKLSAELQAARSRYRTSLDVYRRTREAASERGAVSDSEMERIKNQMLTDSASYESARSGAEASHQLQNYLVIRAAFDGIITQRNVYPGTLVGKGPAPMLVLENLSRLRLRVAIPEAYTSALPQSDTIHFTVDAQPAKKYRATLARKSNEIDEKTRTELWEFEVVNTGKDLKSGMYANATFSLKRNEPTYMVPYSAVVTTLERRFVIRAQDGKAAWVDVRNGIHANDKVEIFGDLEEGDHLLLKPTEELSDGSTLGPLKVSRRSESARP